MLGMFISQPSGKHTAGAHTQVLACLLQQGKMGKLDIDYQVLHDAFFKYQTKPNLSGLGELYYEGKEFEARVSQPGFARLTNSRTPSISSIHKCVRQQHCTQHLEEDGMCSCLLMSAHRNIQALAGLLHIKPKASSRVRFAGEERQGGAGHAAAAGGAGHGGGRPAAVAHQHAALRAAALLPRPAGKRLPPVGAG
jgi:Domain of unknown function (DUF382)